MIVPLPPLSSYSSCNVGSDAIYVGNFGTDAGGGSLWWDSEVNSRFHAVIAVAIVVVASVCFQKRQ